MVGIKSAQIVVITSNSSNIIKLLQKYSVPPSSIVFEITETSAIANLEQAKREYEISRLRVQLSRSRVREQELLSEIGEGDAFEVVRAQDALTASQNQLTSALVNHTLIRLGFWRDLGLLYITKNGKWALEYAQDEDTH